MIARALLLATALLASPATHALAQTRNDIIAAPVLRANVQVTGDLVRIGDIIDNAGNAAQIAIYRAPDLGTTGSLPVAQVLNTLRTHHVIGVDTRELKEISVTRLARTLEGKDIELQIARALERRNGLGDAANLSMTFDRDPGDVRLDASFTGGVQPAIVRYDNRNGRFDITFEIANENGTAPTKLRFAGTAIETVEAAVLARSVERNEVIKSSDVVVERRPKAEVGSDVAAPRPRCRHAGPPPAPRRTGDQDRRSRQARSRAARPERDADLRDGRALSHHARQGAGKRHRRRHRQRDEPAVEAHGVRHRDRARPGFNRRRPVPPGADQRCRAFSRSACRRRHRQFASRSKSRVT